MENTNKDSERTWYWTLVGYLTPDNRIHHLPPILIDHPSRSAGQVKESPLRIDLLDKDERVLVSQPVPYGHFREEVGGRLEERPISGQVPFHPDTQTIRLWNGRVLVKEWLRPPTEPIIGNLMVKRVGKAVRLSWDSKPYNGKEELHYVVRLSQDGGKTFFGISEQIQKCEFEVAENAIPGGKGCLFQVAATDGFQTVTVKSDPVDLPETEPRARIFSPIDGQTLNIGDVATFQGQLVGFIGQDVTMASALWMSDRDGKLAEAPIFQTRKLSDGHHTITLTVRDCKGREGTSTISLYVTNQTMKNP